MAGAPGPRRRRRPLPVGQLGGDGRPAGADPGRAAGQRQRSGRLARDRRRADVPRVGHPLHRPGRRAAAACRRSRRGNGGRPVRDRRSRRRRVRARRRPTDPGLVVPGRRRDRMSRRAANPWRRSTPLVIAHRGQRATYPEQTLEAYEAAIRLGADGIETDVQRTRDGQLVMLHDLTLDRTTNGSGRIADQDWVDVRSLDAGSWFDERFAGIRVPTLEETIELVVAAGLLLCVEIKGSPADTIGTAGAVARLVRRRGLLDQVFISSFDHAALAIARAEAGSPLLAPERLPEAGPSDPAIARAQTVALDAAALQHRWEDLTPDVVDAVHDAGSAIWSWPIDARESVDRSLELRVDAVIGDDVPFLRGSLARTVSSIASP